MVKSGDSPHQASIKCVPLIFNGKNLVAEYDFGPGIPYTTVGVILGWVIYYFFLFGEPDGIIRKI